MCMASSCNLEVAARRWTAERAEQRTRNLSGRVFTGDKLYDVVYWIGDNVTFNRYHRRWRGKRRANAELLRYSDANLVRASDVLSDTTPLRYVRPRSPTDARKDRTNQPATRYSLAKPSPVSIGWSMGFARFVRGKKVNISNRNKRRACYTQSRLDRMLCYTCVWALIPEISEEKRVFRRSRFSVCATNVQHSPAPFCSVVN